jgi:RNA polymerase sigma-70 factor (ECF subfamily)
MAALVLLERLSPLERAVFVLREVFAYDFADVADAVGRSEAACRQLLVRARRHMDSGRPRFEADCKAREHLAARFFDAFRNGDVEQLRNALAADVELVADAGGKAPALGRVVVGADKVARALASLFPRLERIGATLDECLVNGQPGAVLRDRQRKVAFAFALDLEGGRVRNIWSIGNPDKLRHVGPVADAWALKREFDETRPQSAPQASATRVRT